MDWDMLIVLDSGFGLVAILFSDNYEPLFFNTVFFALLA